MADLIHVQVCDQTTIESIARALAACAIGRRVSFGFEGGVTRHLDGERVTDVPNGTATFRLYVDGGAADHQATPEPAR